MNERVGVAVVVVGGVSINHLSSQDDRIGNSPTEGDGSATVHWATAATTSDDYSRAMAHIHRR